MSRKRASIKRPRYEHARLSHDAAIVVDSLECARVHAALVWAKLGARQRRALVDLEVGVAVANPGGQLAYPRCVQRSMALRGLLEHRRDELWELSLLGVAVKLAGTRVQLARAVH